MARETTILENSDTSTGSDIPSRPARESRRPSRKRYRSKSKARDTVSNSFSPKKDQGLSDLLQDLDNGVLKIKDRMRSFTTFLDIKNEYHSEFLKNLWDYVNAKSYSWYKLGSDEQERRACAIAFVDRFGQKYWGETNRAQYLIEDSLKQPDSLCTYPQRKEVIIRTVILLLEKRASSREPLPNGVGEASRPAPVIDMTTSETVQKDRKRSKSRKRHTERESYHNRLTPELGTSDVEDKMDLAVSKTSNGQRNTKHNQGIEIEEFAKLEAKYMHQTTFLLTTDAEQEMFPIHIPFHRFSRVSAFLAFMMDECVLRDKNDIMQVDDGSDISYTAIDYGVERISAASVGLEWCGFKILVRRGREDDWERTIKKLREEWLLREKGDKEVPWDGFNITVRLHLKKSK